MWHLRRVRDHGVAPERDPGPTPELWPLLLRRLLFNSDTFRLGSTCVAAAAALRILISAAREDLSFGQERRCPVMVLPPPSESRQPKLPLDFRYDSGLPPHCDDGDGVTVLVEDVGCEPGCTCSIAEVKGGDGGGGALSPDRGMDGGDGDSGGGGDGGACYGDGGVGDGVGDGSRVRGRGRSQDLLAGCPCGVLVPGHQRAYDPYRAVLLWQPGKGTPGSLQAPRCAASYLLECGPACACARATYSRGPAAPGPHLPAAPAVAPSAAPAAAARCRARLTEQGLGVRVALRWLSCKGWGVVACERIPAGRYVCCYVGEYVTTVEARTRLRTYDRAGGGHALLAVREVLPSGLALRVNLDATRRGNVARFFNHSCDGGNLILLVVRRRGTFLPAVAFFTGRDVSAGEELTFAYGPPNPGPPGARNPARTHPHTGRVAPGAEAPDVKPRAGTGGLCDDGQEGGGEEAGLTPQSCACGSTVCLGFMPSEDV